MDVKRCFDTYALMEIFDGNPKFEKYINSDFVITDLTLVEFYNVILKKYDERTAEYWFKKYMNYSVSVDKWVLKEAIKFKFEKRKTNISFFDAVGYVFSLSNNYPFVTGDKEFENLKGVE